MTTKEMKKVGDVMTRLGQKIAEDPTFIDELDKFLLRAINESKPANIDMAKINNVDLFQLIRERNEDYIDLILSDFNLKELRELLKKYRFGSPSTLKTTSQIKSYIINQLRQRKTDVFRNNDKTIDLS